MLKVPSAAVTAVPIPLAAADASRTPVSYQNAFIGYVRRFDAKNRHTLR